MSEIRARLRASLRALLGPPPSRTPDPAAQLERSVAEAREQHRLLTEQAAVVVANQTRAQVRLERAIEAYGQATAATQGALLLSASLERSGDAAGALAQQRAAESGALRIVDLEHEMEELRATLLEASAASEAARAAVARSASLLKARLAERERLLSRLELARMQEQLNAARAQLDAGIGADAPSVGQVRRDIDERLATARALAEIRPEAVDETRLRLDQALAEDEARARLDGLRQSVEPRADEASSRSDRGRPASRGKPGA